MKILSSRQIGDLDRATISAGTNALELVDRAADMCVRYIINFYSRCTSVMIFLGSGNNGADGFAIALKLQGRGYRVLVVDCAGANTARSTENQSLYKQCQTSEIPILSYPDDGQSLNLTSQDLIIDAMLGNGLNRPVTGRYADCIGYINRSDATVVSIDVPSGLMAAGIIDGPCVSADATLTFQCPRLAYMYRENASYVGRWIVLDIGLSRAAIANQESDLFLITSELVSMQLRPRSIHAHKGDFGYALIVAGHRSMLGAAKLSAFSSMRAGVGKCSLVYQNDLVQPRDNPLEITSTTDDIALTYSNAHWCVGPGLGVEEASMIRLAVLLDGIDKPCVIDADGLTIISRRPELWDRIPPLSILTPHTKELHRLIGECTNDAERIAKAIALAQKRQVIVVVKGHHTAVINPSGMCYFNNTGNPGMATGGSGDVLSGVITGYLCQGYEPLWSAILGVYMHGRAGDIAAQKIGENSMIASDITQYLSIAIQEEIQ